MRTFILVLFLLFYSILVADGVEPNGSGTETNPYQIADLDNILWLSTNGISWHSKFIQTADIDVSGTDDWNTLEGFCPIGTWNVPFTGSYDGMGHSIYGLNIHYGYDVGMFSVISNASIKNLTLSSIDYSTEVSGSCGGLVVYMSHSEVVNCHVNGTITGYYYSGGLIGFCYDDSNVSQSSSQVSINGAYYANGGLIGQSSGSIVSNCFYIGNMNNSAGNSAGLIGINLDAGLLMNSYSLVTDNSPNAYALIGLNEGGIENCVWNSSYNNSGAFQAGNNSAATNVVDCTEAEMRLESTYLSLGWDFIGETENGEDELWTIELSENNGFPTLVTYGMHVTPIEDTFQAEEISAILYNAYPNPFKPETTLSFDVKENDVAKLMIFNVRGQMIKSYPEFRSGYHMVNWKGVDMNDIPVTSGVYFYRLETGQGSQTKKIMLLK